MLSYNLFQKTLGQSILASDLTMRLNTPLSNLRAILSWWNKHKGDPLSHPQHVGQVLKSVPKMMAYMFRYRYKEANLSFDFLEGIDFHIASLLKEVAATEDIFFCLANITKIVVTTNEEDGHIKKQYSNINRDIMLYPFSKDGESKEHISISLDYVAELDGSKIGRDVYFDEEHIVEYYANNSIPDDEISGTQFYHGTVCFAF